MLNSSAEVKALQATVELEAVVLGVEQHLAALAESLRERDGPAVERQAQELHRALAQAVERFMLAARQGGVPDALRHRLARASGQVARQRDALARATAALDRAIDVLMPGQLPVPGLYSASGLHDTRPLGGTLSA